VRNAIVSAAIGAGVTWLIMRDRDYSSHRPAAGESGAEVTSRIGIPERFTAPEGNVPRAEIGSLPESGSRSAPTVSVSAAQLPVVAQGPQESKRLRVAPSAGAFPVTYQTPPRKNIGSESVVSAPISRITENGIGTALAIAEQFAAPFEKEGFTRREDYWGGVLDYPDKAITQQLFRGNEYWFSVGTDVLAAEIDTHVYDSDGNLVDAAHEEGPRAAVVRVKPQNTGAYYIIVSGRTARELSLPAGQAVHWAMAYGYR
jgi:hypothetical protein